MFSPIEESDENQQPLADSRDILDILRSPRDDCERLIASQYICQRRDAIQAMWSPSEKKRREMHTGRGEAADAE
jgi:hypothetical protein